MTIASGIATGIATGIASGIASTSGGGFIPPNIRGLQTWYSSDYGVYQDGAAHFTAASQQYLTCADNATLPDGDVDLWIAGWFYADSLPASATAMSKWSGAGGQQSWALYLPSTHPVFIVSSDGTDNATVTSTVTPTTGSFFFALIWHDSVNNTINIRCGGEAAQTQSYSLGIFSSTSPFRISGIVGTQFWEGRADSVCFGKSPVGGVASQINDIYTTLYNGGTGVTSSGVTSAQRTAWGGVSFYDLNEESGTRFDAWGTNDLTASTHDIISGATLNGNFETAGTNGGTITGVPSATVGRTANIATVTTSISHGLSSTNVITTTGFTDTSFNAVGKVVTVVNATTFTFPSTGSDVVLGADTGGRIATDVFANWTESTSGTSTVNNETSVVHAGTHACRFDIDASNSQCNVVQAAMVVGNYYSYSVWSKASGSGPKLRISDNLVTISDNALSTTYTQFSGTFVAKGTGFFFLSNSGTSKSIYIDDLVLTDLGPVGIAGIAAGLATDGNFCGQFNGTSQYLNSTASFPISSISTGSISVWVNPDAFPNVNAKAINIYKDGNNEIEIYFPDATSVILYGSSGGVNIFSLSKSLTFTPGSWYHIVGTWSATGANLYVNAGSPATAAGDKRVSISGNGTAYIGEYGGGSSFYWAGRIDSPQVWGKELSASEVTTLFNTGNGLKYGGLSGSLLTSLVAAWDLDKKDGITVAAFGGYTLTNNNAVTYGQGVDYFGGAVSKWLDRSGNNRNLLQITEAKRPIWYSGVQNGKPAILFDGVDDYLQALYTLAQPVTVFMVAKSVTWTEGDYLIDGGSSNAMVLQQHSSSGDIYMFAGSYGGHISLGTTSFGVLTAIFNGASSQLQLNNGTASASDAGSATTAGLTVGSHASGAFNGNIYACEIIEYNSALTAAQITQVNNYLGTKYNINVTPPAAPTLPLDINATASGAFSTRLLRTTYAGSALNAKRSSDNSVQDIGFSSGNFDSTGLSSFMGASTDGYVVTWYDQSANAADLATTNNDTLRPKVWKSSAAVTGVNSKQAIVGDQAGAKLGTGIASVYITDTAMTFFAVVISDATIPAGGTADAGSTIWGERFGTTGLGFFNNNQVGFYGVDSGLKTAADTAAAATKYLLTGKFNGSTLSLQVNNNAAVTQACTTLASITDAFGVINVSGNVKFTGYMNELIFYKTALSGADVSAIQSNINSYYSIY